MVTRKPPSTLHVLSILLGQPQLDLLGLSGFRKIKQDVQVPRSDKVKIENHVNLSGLRSRALHQGLSR
jgi:hypothetical protein